MCKYLRAVNYLYTKTPLRCSVRQYKYSEGRVINLPNQMSNTKSDEEIVRKIMGAADSDCENLEEYNKTFTYKERVGGSICEYTVHY